MRIRALTALAALALAAPPGARAQEPGALPRDLADRVTEVLNHPATDRREGATAVEAGRTVASDLAVLDGALQLAGRVEGNVVVVNGDLDLAQGAQVTGDVVVVGGEIQVADQVQVDGEMVVFAEPVTHCRRGARLDVGGRCGPPPPRIAWRTPAVQAGGAAPGDGDAEPEEAERARIAVAAGATYNRVEGLPIRVGPELETGVSNPLRIRAMAILRTEPQSDAAPGQWGYDARLEQFMGGYRAFRVGARVFSVVEPIEAWHLTDVENSLSTLLLHQDYRDYYEREGWSAYAVVNPVRSPVTVTGELLWERHRSVAPGDPWAVFGGDEGWRMQPLVAEGPLRALQGTVLVDTRSEEWDPSSGWFVRAQIEHTLASDLVRPAFVATGGAAPAVVRSNRFGEYTRGLLDLRRYNRISPSARLNMRIAVGGSMSIFPIPPQRQHALGGEGTLPGYPLFALACGAREAGGTRGAGAPAADEPRFFTGYGCDRFALFQAEYRGDLSFGRSRGDGGAGPAGVFDAGLGWVVFTDVGAGWTSLEGHHDTGAAIDVGAGLLLGDVGVYAAMPVHDVYDRGRLDFFIRLAPRF